MDFFSTVYKYIYNWSKKYTITLEENLDWNISSIILRKWYIISRRIISVCTARQHFIPKALILRCMYTKNHLDMNFGGPKRIQSVSEKFNFPF